MLCMDSFLVHSYVRVAHLSIKLTKYEFYVIMNTIMIINIVEYIIMAAS